MREEALTPRQVRQFLATTDSLEKWERTDGTLSKSEFEWDAQANEYRCPQGHALRSDRRQFKNPRDRITKAHTIIYRSSYRDCAGCSIKEQCCPNTRNRKIVRSVHEDARDVARCPGGREVIAEDAYLDHMRGAFALLRARHASGCNPLIFSDR